VRRAQRELVGRAGSEISKKHAKAVFLGILGHVIFHVKRSMGHKGPPMAESDWDGSSGEVEREFTAMSLPNVSLPCHCPM